MSGVEPNVMAASQKPTEQVFQLLHVEFSTFYIPNLLGGKRIVVGTTSR